MSATGQSKADKRKNIDNIYPLSPLQEGFLFHALLAPEAGLYAPQVAIGLAGDIDTAALKGAWEEAVRRHEILRNGFYWEQREEPFQVTHREAELAWTEQDWSELSEQQQALKLEVVKACNRSEPFDLQCPPLMRLQLIKTAAAAYKLIWCHHHLILDGWSASQLFKDVFQLYLQRTGVIDQPLPAPRPYSHYIAWLKRQNGDAGADFWSNYLHGIEGATQLTAHMGTAAIKKGAGEQRAKKSVSFSREQTQALRDFCQSRKITLNSLLQGALALLLGRYTGSDDVIFGATTSGRPADLPGATSMVGLFINTLPVRVRLRPAALLSEWLQQLQARQAAAAEYEYMSLREIQRRNYGGRSLFDCLLVFENYPIDRESFKTRRDIAITGVDFEGWTHYPLVLLVNESEQLAIHAKFATDFFPEGAIERLLNHLRQLLDAMVGQPEARLHQLLLLTEAEKRQLALWNDTRKKMGGGSDEHHTLTHWLETRAQQSAQHPAVIFEGGQLTYGELHSRANRLGHWLQERGLGPERRVAVYLERSPALVVCLLAIVKTGAAYVPLDPGYPRSRNQWMLTDSGAQLLLTDSGMSLPPLFATEPEAPEGECSHITCIDLAERVELDRQPDSAPEADIHPDNPAYLIYTSGSTGRPKGVVNTHRGIVNRLLWMRETYALAADDRILHKTPLGFDVSVWEIFWPLIGGAAIVIARPEGHRDTDYLAAAIQTHAVTTVHFVPPMLDAFLEEPQAPLCTSLRRVFSGGEALSAALQRRFFERFPASAPAPVRLYNQYGPAEAAIDVTFWPCQPGDGAAVPIGRPIANTEIHLLDASMAPVPVGVAGELYIGGDNLARGYLNRADLTAEHFVPNPFYSPDGNARPPGLDQCTVLYKTGDLARYRPDGAIEFLGRIDHQVKLRGVRIELGEIEAVLERFPGVRQAIAVAFDEEGGDSAQRSIAAFVTLTPPAQPAPEQLRLHARRHLPEVMVPGAIEILDALPLTPNGKPDRAALKKPRAARQAEYMPPATETEIAIADIWREVLKTPSPGSRDNFFDLGGHSLKAIRIIARLRSRFDLELPMQILFERPVLSDLADYIDALRLSQQPPLDKEGRVEVNLF